MTIGNKFYKRFSKTNGAIRTSFSGIDQSKENQFCWQNWKEARSYGTHECKHWVSKQVGEKDFFHRQVKVMASALSVPLSFVIIPLSRDLKKLKQKQMDKTSKMLRLWKQGHEILMHEYGLVRRRQYLKRDLDEIDAS